MKKVSLKVKTEEILHLCYNFALVLHENALIFSQLEVHNLFIFCYTIYKRNGYLHLHYQWENFHYLHGICLIHIRKKKINCTYIYKFVFLYLQLLNLIPY